MQLCILQWGKIKQINSILTGGLCLNVLGFSAGCQKGPKAREQLGQVRSACGPDTSHLWGLSRELLHVLVLADIFNFSLMHKFKLNIYTNTIYTYTLIQSCSLSISLWPIG